MYSPTAFQTAFSLDFGVKDVQIFAKTEFSFTKSSVADFALKVIFVFNTL